MSDGSQEQYIGVDIGGTRSAVVLGDGSGRILDERAFATDRMGGPDAVIDRVRNEIHHVARSHTVEAIGISCGGPLDSEQGVILGPPNLPGWEEVHIVEAIAADADAPVYLENDANAGALAEWKFGAGRGCSNLIYITAGTGLGCGLILGGTLYSGTNDMAGEAGHIRLADNGPVGYGKAGSFEGFCSGGGIARLAQYMMDADQADAAESKLKGLAREGTLTTKAIAEAAVGGDEFANEVLDRAAEKLGQGLAILIDILNPEVIVVGSLGLRLGDRYLGPARRIVAREALPRSVHVCRIVPPQLGEDVQKIAALCVAMRAGR